MESKQNDTVVHVVAESITKVHGVEGWGPTGDEFGVDRLRAHKHGWFVTEKPKPVVPEQTYKAGDIIDFGYGVGRYVVLKDGKAQYISTFGVSYSTKDDVVDLAKLLRGRRTPTVVSTADDTAGYRTSR